MFPELYAQEVLRDWQQRQLEERARLASELARARDQDPTSLGFRFRVEPGMEQEFACVLDWLAVSFALDRMIEAAGDPPPPSPHRLAATAVAPAAPERAGLRARTAAQLARIALALHRDAATRALRHAGHIPGSAR